jgi:hypothetical protein
MNYFDALVKVINYSIVLKSVVKILFVSWKTDSHPVNIIRLHVKIIFYDLLWFKLNANWIFF